MTTIWYSCIARSETNVHANVTEYSTPGANYVHGGWKLALPWHIISLHDHVAGILMKKILKSILESPLNIIVLLCGTIVYLYR